MPIALRLCMIVLYPLFGLGVATAHAQDVFAGKALTLIVGNTAGSGYDSYGRLISRYMAKFLNAKQSVVVQNMPGAGSVKATDYIYTIAPKDGTTFGMVVPGALADPLTAEPGRYRYDPRKLEYIGTADVGTRLCFTRGDSKVKTLEDAQKATVIVGATQPAAYARMLNAVAGTKFQVVTGYPGPAEILMALERGESEAICALDYNAVNALRPGLLTSGAVNVLVQINFEPKEFLSEKNVPQIWKYVSPQDRPLVELMVTEQIFQRVFIAPPGVPADGIKALRAAFDSAMKDPDLLAEAKQLNLEINPKSGEEVARYVQKMYAAPPDVIERVAAIRR